MKRFAIAGFALGLMATAAAAADMPVPYAKAPPPPEFSWTGLYVGGNAGWLQLEENGYPFCLDPTGAMQGPGCSIVQGGQMGSSHGFFGGGQVGYNWQAGKLVLGIEADMQGVNLKASENIPGPFAHRRPRFPRTPDRGTSARRKACPGSARCGAASASPSTGSSST